MVAFVELQGNSVCPTAGEVAARLRDLIPAADTVAAPRERVLLRSDGGALALELRDDLGRTLARRRFEAAACDDVAQAAAVVIAAWATELRSAGAAEVVLPRARRRAVGFELAAAFVAALAGASFAPGGELAVTLGPRRGRLLGRLLATATAPRDLRLGAAAPAHATFLRASLALGPVVRFRPRRWLVDLDAEASVALVYIGSVGFADSASAFDADLGLGGGARAAVRLGAVAPFVGVRLVGWLRPLAATAVGPTGGSASLPRFEALFTAGIAFGND